MTQPTDAELKALFEALATAMERQTEALEALAARVASLERRHKEGTA